MTAMMFAAYNGSIEIITLLLESNSDIDLQSGSGWTATMIAVVNRHIGVLNKLLQYNPKLHLRNSVRLFTLCRRLLYHLHLFQGR